MKKFRKAIVALLAMVMVIGCLTVQASAAETYIYVTGGFCGWDWANCATLTSNDDDVYTGQIVASGAQDVVLNVAKNWDAGDSGKFPYIYNGGSEGIQQNIDFSTAGIYSLTYTKSTKVLDIQFVSAVSYTYEYFIAGPAELGANDWAGDETAEAGKMTEEGGKYTITTTATGEATEFCVVKKGTSNVQGSAPSVDWLKDPATEKNFAVEGVEDGSSVKITFNPDDGTCTVLVTAPGATIVPGGGTDDDTGSDSDAGNTGSGSGSDSDTGSGSDSDAGDTGSDSGNKPEISDNSVTQEEIDAMKDSVKVEGTTEKLVVSPITKDAADLKVVEAAVAKELKGVKYVVADLKFESGKQPTAGTKITIDVTKMADVKAAKFVAVYSIDDGKLELVDTVEVKDGKITFAPKHFSTYVFAEAADPKSDPDNGIANTAVIVSAIVMLAAATVIVASKKRVTE